jgi:nicotinate-nucleotide pyrophosphorylase (carboxylating)
VRAILLADNRVATQCIHHPTVDNIIIELKCFSSTDGSTIQYNTIQYNSVTISDMATLSLSSESDHAVDFSGLLAQGAIEKVVRQWLEDDMPSMMDVGGLVVGTEPRTAKLWMKSPGVFAGKVFFEAVFHQLQCTVTWEEPAATEGVLLLQGNHNKSQTSSKIHLATVVGPANKILQGERTALNVLSRCSGVATLSRQAVDRARESNWKGWIAGTRKTTPGFRIVEKYGLLVGGAATHRLDLSQMVMLKDNHIWSAGSITHAVLLARKAAGFSQKIEVECQSLQQGKHRQTNRQTDNRPTGCIHVIY